jgi:hypothetical protein
LNGEFGLEPPRFFTYAELNFYIRRIDYLYTADVAKGYRKPFDLARAYRGVIESLPKEPSLPEMHAATLKLRAISDAAAAAIGITGNNGDDNFAGVR